MDSPESTNLCGITGEELDEYFQVGIGNLGESMGITAEKVRQRLQEDYDGYHFSNKSPDIYNPFSLVNVFAKNDMGSYWFESGTPTYLVKHLKRINLNLSKIAPCEIDKSELETTGVLSPNPIPVLYQSGYLTIKGNDREFAKYRLDYPNREVREGFLKFLIPYYLTGPDSKSTFDIKKFVEAVKSGDIQLFMSLLKSLLAG